MFLDYSHAVENDLYNVSYTDFNFQLPNTIATGQSSIIAPNLPFNGQYLKDYWNYYPYTDINTQLTTTFADNQSSALENNLSNITPNQTGND